MKIIHLLTDVAFNASSLEELKKQIEDMYSLNGFKPEVTIEKNMVIVDIDDKTIAKYDEQFHKAAELCAEGKASEGREILSLIVRECPAFSEAYRLLAQLKMNEGLIDEAIDIDVEALKHNPRNIWALVLMGNLFSKYKDDIDTAMTYYKQVLEYSPNNAIALCNIGGILVEKGKHMESIDYFNKSLEIDNTYGNAYYGKALALKRLGFNLLAFQTALEGSLNAKRLPENPGVREEIIKMMIASAQEAVKETDYTACWKETIKQLEKDGCRTIQIKKDSTLDVYAKLEYGPTRRRDYHVVKYNPGKEYVDHLVMHELMHLRLDINNANAGLGQIIVSTPEQKKTFEQRFWKNFKKLHQKVDYDDLRKVFDHLFNGLMLQIMNCPMDLFVEDMIYKTYPAMQPIQLLSLLRQEQDNIYAVKQGDSSKMFPAEIVSLNRVMNIVTSLHLKKLFGVDLINEYNPTKLEYDQAKDLFDEYEAYVDTFKTADEYELVMYFAESMNMDDYITIEPESKFLHEAELETLWDNINKNIWSGDSHQPSREEIKKINEDFAERHKDGADETQTMMMTMNILEALKDFAQRPKDEVKMIALEMAMVSSKGIKPEGKYSIPAYPRKEFNGWQFLAYYYAACAQELPELLEKLGLPFSTAYQSAKSLFLNIVEGEEQRDVSYGELAELEKMFYERIEAIGAVFPDEDVESECLFDYQQQYIDGSDSPVIRFLWDDDPLTEKYDKKYRELYPEDFE